MVKKKKNAVKTGLTKNKESVGFAFLGIFLTILGYLIVWAIKREDDYAMHYAKQGLVIFLVGVIIMVIGWIPIIGWIVGRVAGAVLFALWILGIVYVFQGKKKDIPIIGELSRKF